MGTLKPRQQGLGSRRVAEAELAQCVGDLLRVVRQRERGLFLRLTAGDDFLKDGMHPLANVIQFLFEALPVGVAEGKGDRLLLTGVSRKIMGLPVGILLQAVFHDAQVGVAFQQCLHGFCRHQAQFAQAGQYCLNPAFAQGFFVATANQLKRLADELDFTDAARPQLDVFLPVLADQFQRDFPLQFAQFAQRPVVEVAAINERTQKFLQFAARLEVTGDGTHLDHGVAFPFPRLALVIGFHGVEAQHQWSGITKGAQPGIGAENKAIFGDGVQHFHQVACQSGVELGVAGFPAVIEFAIVAEGEDQVDVRREIQLPGAQLAHAKHRQILRIALLIDRRAA